MGFWHEPDFKHDEFRELIEGFILGKMEGLMADLAKLKSDIDAQSVLIGKVTAKVDAQAAKIADLEAQIAATTASDPQAPVDALVASVEANNAALTSAGA